MFSNDLGVIEATKREVKELPFIGGWFDRLPDLLDQPDSDLVIGHPSWLLRPDLYPAQAALQPRCLEFFNQLQPVPEIQSQVEAFLNEYVQQPLIGVHLRRGDFLHYRPDVSGNLEEALAAVNEFLERFPGARILLCSDEDPAAPGAVVHARFAKRYNHLLVQHQLESLDRGSVEGIQQALVDLWLLRTTHAFVGTTGSSFSELVVWGRAIPWVFCAAPISSYARVERLARLTGLYTLLYSLARFKGWQDVPFPALLLHYRAALLRRLPRSWQTKNSPTPVNDRQGQ